MKYPSIRLQKPPRSRYERMPRACLVLYGLSAFCAVLYVILINSTAFADWFNGTVSAALRGALSYLTAWIPFSLGELAIWLIPVFLFLILRHAIRCRCESWRSVAVYVGMLLSVISLLFSVFVLTFTAGYRTSPLNEKLGLEREMVSVTELQDTMILLAEAVSAESENISFRENGFSSMPHTFAEMNEHLSDAYEAFGETYDFLPRAATQVKPVLLSEVMSYMHITGVYSFFTGEANVNVGFPDYTLPATAAHELAHQRGIAREDEANFLSFLVCTGSDDPYLRYSGYLMAYEYVADALWQADSDLYYDALAHLSNEVRGELVAYREFFKTYEDSTASNISSSINDFYLQTQDTPGLKSYGMVVDLLVAYYRP